MTRLLRIDSAGRFFIKQAYHTSTGGRIIKRRFGIAVAGHIACHRHLLKYPFIFSHKYGTRKNRKNKKKLSSG
jgi:hypothetical protein